MFTLPSLTLMLRKCQQRVNKGNPLLYTAIVNTAVAHIITHRLGLFQAIVTPLFTLFSTLPNNCVWGL